MTASDRSSRRIAAPIPLHHRVRKIDRDLVRNPGHPAVSRLADGFTDDRDSRRVVVSTCKGAHHVGSVQPSVPRISREFQQMAAST
jgi:hypothetical protein